MKTVDERQNVLYSSYLPHVLLSIFYVKMQVVGTPDDGLQQITELQRLTGLDHLVAEFSFGGMPHEESEINMRLVADRLLSVLQRDAAFANYAPVAPADAPAGHGQQAEDVFAPA